MAGKHVFVQTNFLFGVFRLPSKRQRDALKLRKRFEAGEIKLYLPYLCLQEARNLIAKSLPSRRCADILEFHRYASDQGAAAWDFDEARKLIDAATAEVDRTKATYQRELAAFAAAVGDGLLHGTHEIFDFLEALDLDDDNLKYNDKLILSSVLVKAGQLKQSGEQELFFATIDTSDLQPTPHRPKMSALYQDAGLEFVPGFLLPGEATGLGGTAEG